MGQDSSVGIATRYGLDGPGINRVGARYSALGPTQPPVQWEPGLSQRSECAVDHPSPSSVEVKGRGAIPLLPLWAFVACSRANFTFTVRNA